jgi:AraC family transcriptional regulator of adaptative response / DNA-3-methyladenine glycosylase II
VPRVRRGYIAAMTSDLNIAFPDPSLDPQLCRRARLSRDPRFDGEFFIGVHTTGIYCRPICPVRPPAEKNVSYYRDAARAAQAGFRPCLRCRPESAPNSPAWNGTSTTVERALQLIRQGALNEGALEELADRLGIGERYLRKLFEQELGVSPQAVALNQRLLFAKKLLAETSLPMTEVAFASGFGSVRRFNSAVKAWFKLAPSALRRQRKTPLAGSPIRLQLQYRPPYDWDGVMDFFERHAINGVETASQDGYQRNILIDGAPSNIKVSPVKGKDALLLELHVDDHSLLMPVVANIRRMFDLDANPAAIKEVLGLDPILAPLLAHFEGIRSPSSWSLFESAVRSIVGQQVSIKAARSVLGRLAAAVGEDADTLTFPNAAGIAALPDKAFPMPTRRRDTLRTICQHYSGCEDDVDLATLASFKGIGPWTTALVAMRGLGQPDIFPLKDLGLDNAWAELEGGKTPLQDRMADWRPWGSYAANLLWRSLSL